MSGYILQVLPEFLSAAKAMPKDIKAKLFKCLDLLCNNYRHPSLQTKKIQGNANAVFECRVDQEIRLIYDIQGQVIRCWHVGFHDPALKYGEKLSNSYVVDDIRLSQKLSSYQIVANYLNKGLDTIEFITANLDDLCAGGDLN